MRKGDILVRTSVRLRVCAHKHTHTHKCTHAHAHPRTHTHTHTHTHTQVETQSKNMTTLKSKIDAMLRGSGAAESSRVHQLRCMPVISVACGV